MDPDLSSSLLTIYISPFTLETALLLLIVFFLLFCFGIISASESAFFSLRLEDIEKENNPVDKHIRKILENPERLSASVLTGSCFFIIFFISVFVYTFHQIVDYTESYLGVFFIQLFILVCLVLFLGEMFPRIIVKKNPLKFARLLAKPMLFVEKITSPFSSLMFSVDRVVNLSRNKKKHKHNISVDELSKALELTSGEIKDEKDILEGIINFYDKTVAQIMTSRIDISALEIHSDFKKVIDYVIDAGYSRIPIYSGTCDTIKGILYIKDLLPHIGKPATFRWQSLIRPAFFIPETKKIDDLLEEFRADKIHLAVVVDEFGGTSGVVTLEDILEEIVGEISDEYDDEDSRYTKLSDGSYVFEAKTLLTDFFKITGVHASEFKDLVDEVETLAGLALEIKGNFPEKKEIISFGKYVFQVLEINKRRILKIKFSVLEKVVV